MANISDKPRDLSAAVNVQYANVATAEGSRGAIPAKVETTLGGPAVVMEKSPATGAKDVAPAAMTIAPPAITATGVPVTAQAQAGVRVRAVDPVALKLAEQGDVGFHALCQMLQPTLTGIQEYGYLPVMNTLMTALSKVNPDATEVWTLTGAQVAALSLAAATWSVKDDLKNGRLQPSAFQQQSFALVTPEALFAEAQRRLADPKFDVESAAWRMTKDPAWKDAGLVAGDVAGANGRPAPLTPDILRTGVVKRAVAELGSASSASKRVEFSNLIPVKLAREAAVRAASQSVPGMSALDIDRGTLLVYVELARGLRPYEATTGYQGQIAFALAAAGYAQVDVIAATEEFTDAVVKAAKQQPGLLPYQKLTNPDTGKSYIVRYKSLEQVSRELYQRAQAGAFNSLAEPGAVEKDGVRGEVSRQVLDLLGRDGNKLLAAFGADEQSRKVAGCFDMRHDERGWWAVATRGLSHRFEDVAPKSPGRCERDAT